MAKRGYLEVVRELERAFDEEKEAISRSDMEGVSRLLSGIEGLLVELLEAAREAGPREAAEAFRWASRRREENARLLRGRMEEVGADLARVREERRAAAAYAPPAGPGRLVDREA